MMVNLKNIPGSKYRDLQDRLYMYQKISVVHTVSREIDLSDKSPSLLLVGGETCRCPFYFTADDFMIYYYRGSRTTWVVCANI